MALKGVEQRLLASALPANGSRRELELWLERAAARGADPSWRVLDAGAGDAPYRHLFDGVRYETADSGAIASAGQDHACDLANLPMADCTYDQLICTQVLEHVVDPDKVMSELARVLRPGGTMWVSAPLFYEEHGQPHDYRRFTQFAWRQMAEAAGLDVLELEWLEGYDDTLAYQCEVAVRSLRGPTMVPFRLLFLVLARVFAWRGSRTKRTDAGMPKNYRCVLRKSV